MLVVSILWFVGHVIITDNGPPVGNDLELIAERRLNINSYSAHNIYGEEHTLVSGMLQKTTNYGDMFTNDNFTTYQ